MTILYLHQYFKTSKQSGGTRSYEMARRFIKEGHRVIMITSDTDTQEHEGWHELNIDGIEVHSLPVFYNNSMSYSQRIKAFFKFAFYAGRKASSFSADVIFATSTPLTIAIPAIYAKKRLRIPMVFEVRDLWPDVPISLGVIKNSISKYFARKLEKYAYIHSSHIIALSIDMKNGILRNHQINESSISIIPNSSDNEMFVNIDSDFRIRHSWLSNRQMILYAGTLGLVNGVGYLAEVAKAMKDINEEVSFVIIGDGKEKEQIKKRAEKIGVLNQNFFMLDPVPKKDLPNIYASTDIATSVVIDNESLWSNSANKFFDSLAAGVPIAINHGGWQKSELEKFQAGIVLNPTDYRKAAIDLNDLLSNKEKLGNMAKNAKKLAVEKYDRDILAKELLGILEKQANA